jgi:hypothetical protein
MKTYIIRARYGYFCGFSDAGEPLFCEHRSGARRMVSGRAGYLARMLTSEGCGDCQCEPN